jgi:hypothetical protein
VHRGLLVQTTSPVASDWEISWAAAGALVSGLAERAAIWPAAPTAEGCNRRISSTLSRERTTGPPTESRVVGVD